MANERTFLAQLRTGVAIIALGFVVARFGIFLHGNSGGGPASRDTLIGALITGLGAVVVLTAAIRYVRRHRAIARGAFHTSPLVDVLLAACLAIGGLALALYLILPGA